jgi:hypothetical protein
MTDSRHQDVVAVTAGAVDAIRATVSLDEGFFESRACDKCPRRIALEDDLERSLPAFFGHFVSLTTTRDHGKPLQRTATLP